MVEPTKVLSIQPNIFLSEVNEIKTRILVSAKFFCDNKYFFTESAGYEREQQLWVIMSFMMSQNPRQKYELLSKNVQGNENSFLGDVTHFMPLMYFIHEN